MHIRFRVKARILGVDLSQQGDESADFVLAATQTEEKIERHILKKRF